MKGGVACDGASPPRCSPALGVRARRRPDRRDEHGRGVVGRRRPRPRPARRRGGRRHRHRADELRRLDLVPRDELRGDRSSRATPGTRRCYQPHWREGGAVNAIEKAQVVLDAIKRLRDGVVEALRPAPSAALDARRPADDDPRRRVGGHVPGLVHDHDRGSLRSRSRPTRRAGRSRSSARWTSGSRGPRPPIPGSRSTPRPSDWWPNRVMSLEISPDEPIVAVMSEATADVGRPGAPLGSRLLVRRRDVHAPRRHARDRLRAARASSRTGAASRTRSTSTFRSTGLVDCAKGLAVAAMRFCRVARRDRSRAPRRHRRPEGAGRPLRRGGGVSRRGEHRRPRVDRPGRDRRAARARHARPASRS